MFSCGLVVKLMTISNTLSLTCSLYYKLYDQTMILTYMNDQI